MMRHRPRASSAPSCSSSSPTRCVFVAALVNIVFERRVLAFMQDRHGPNRTGPHGVLQSVADAFKMMGKEDFRPALADPVPVHAGADHGHDRRRRRAARDPLHRTA